MSKLKVRKKTPRAQSTVKLHRETKQLLDHLVLETGHDRNVLITRMLNWFSRRPRPVQAWVLGALDEPSAEWAAETQALLDEVEAALEAEKQKALG